MRIILKGKHTNRMEERVYCCHTQGRRPRGLEQLPGDPVLSTQGILPNCIILKRLFKELDDVGFVKESFPAVTKLLKLLCAAPQAAVESHGAYVHC